MKVIPVLAVYGDDLKIKGAVFKTGNEAERYVTKSINRYDLMEVINEFGIEDENGKLIRDYAFENENEAKEKMEHIKLKQLLRR